MRVPEIHQRIPFMKRKMKRLKIVKEGERQCRKIVNPEGLLSRRPAQVIVLALVLAVAGGALMVRSKGGGYSATRGHRLTKAMNEVTVLRAGVEMYWMDCGEYPATNPGLKALVLNPGVSNWRGPYVSLIRPDPWRQPYVYRIEDGRPVVKSSGLDGKPDTADDLLPAPDEDLPIPEVYRERLKAGGVRP
jgi:general secretion pathway protein G